MKLPSGYKLKDGKVIKVTSRRLSVSEKIRQKKSKRQKVVRRQPGN